MLATSSDVFAVPFEEIAAIIDRTPEAARQLASCARRRVQAKESDGSSNLSEQRKVVDAFLAALQSADFERLVAVLDPDVLVRIDEAAGHPGGPERYEAGVTGHGARSPSRKSSSSRSLPWLMARSEL